MTSISEAKQVMLSAPIYLRSAAHVLVDECDRLTTLAQHAQDLAEGEAVCLCCRLRAARISGRCTNCAPSVDRTLAQARLEPIATQEERRRDSNERRDAERTAAVQIALARAIFEGILAVPFATDNEVVLQRAVWNAMRRDAIQWLAANPAQ